MEDEPSLKRELQRLLDCYHRDLASKKPEHVVDAWIGELDALIPHSNISDLLFWGERERTEEQAIDEALRRDRIFREDGELALLLHMESQLSEALADRSRPAYCLNYAENELPHIRERIAGFAGGGPH